jgi:alpha-amylase
MSGWSRAAALASFVSWLLPACSVRAPVSDAVDAGVVEAHSVRSTEAAVALDPTLFWNSATIYFLLTDRFHDGDPTNNLALGRAQDGAALRSFQGGDLAGVLEKLEDGYFDSLGVHAIWMTPFVEQIHGSTDEGTGKTYGYHGYWIRDWTAVEPALGTEGDLRALVDAAHRRGIRVIMDAVINHTGPVTPEDPVWPEEWVRTEPRCAYEDYATTVTCTLVENLPDIRTDRDDPVELPPSLVEKWQREGRLERELAELDAFFERTGYPRAPRYYVMKWLTDWVRELGFDGYRVDTAKHFEEAVSAELRREAERALAEWREANPDKALEGQPFYMMGEVYNYNMTSGREFDFGDRTVNFFDFGYDGLINFDFKQNTGESLDELFTRYAAALGEGDLRGVSIVNYVSSHDDSSPFDPDREVPIATGTRLLLAPGAAQVYYGDELARPLQVEDALGDANLRSVLDWAELGRDTKKEILAHWRRLGRFRQAHPAVGAGEHRRLQAEPYIFSRVLDTDGITDRVLVALDQPVGPKSIPAFGVFPEGAELVDGYSGMAVTVKGGRVSLDSPYRFVLLGESE